MSANPFNTTIAPNTTQREDTELFSENVEIAIRMAYCLVTIVGLLGNGLVFILIATRRVDHTAFNLLLANLAVADFLADISLYPYVFIDLKGFEVNELTGRILCNFTIGLTTFFICTSVSLLTLTTISINRYICINHPLRFEWQQSKKTAKTFIIFTWIFGVIFISPNFFSFSYQKDWGICRRQWPVAINGVLYSLITSFLALVIPIAVLLYTFIATVKNLRTKICDVSVTIFTRNSRKKTIRLLAWLIIVFCSCWTPFFIYWLLSRSTNVFQKGNHGDYQRMRAIRLTILAAAINTTADPLLYALFSEQYRIALKKLFKPKESMTHSSSRNTSVMTSFPTRIQAITCNERSSFSMKALEEEFRGHMTPVSSMVMAHMRGSPDLSNYMETKIE